MVATSRMLIEAIMPGVTPAEVAALFSGNTGVTSGRPGLVKLINLLTKQGTQRRMKMRIGVDTATAKAAAGTVTIVYATTLIGEWVQLNDGHGNFRLTCVTSGTPVNGDGTFLKSVDATTTAAAFVVAFNTLPGVAGRWLASNSAGVVTITAVGDSLGLVGNLAKLAKSSATGLALVQPVGGLNADTKVALTAALSGALTANDTVTIGSVVLTAKAAPSGEDEFAATVSAAADGAALAAAINAHTKLKGIVTASGTATITMTCQQGGRIGALITVAKSAAAITLSAASFVASVLDVYQSAPVEILLGVP